MSEAISKTIRNVLTSKAPAPEPGQQRSVPRYAVRARVTICPLRNDRPDGRPEKVWLRDVSPMGLGFLHQKPMTIGQRFQVHLPDLDDLSLKCVVARCERMSGDQFVIGASFLSVGPADSAEGATSPGAAEPGGTAGTPIAAAVVTRVAAHTAARGSAAAAANAPSAAADLAERVKRATSQSPTPTALIGLDRRIVWTNEPFARLLGVAVAAELAGVPLETAVKAPNARSAPPLQAGKVRTAYGRRDGAVVTVDQTISTLRDASGGAAFLLAVVEPVEAEQAKSRLAASSATLPQVGSEIDFPQSQTTTDRDAEVERIRRAMFG